MTAAVLLLAVWVAASVPVGLLAGRAIALRDQR